MTLFPDLFRVALVDANTNRSAGADILTSITLQVQSHDYYKTNLGLSDEAGIVSISLAKLKSDFSHDQRLFPMDYRVPIESCDSRVIVSLRGGAEFLAHRKHIFTSTLVERDVRGLYERAANELFESGTEVVDLPAPLAVDTVLVVLKVQRVVR